MIERKKLISERLSKRREIMDKMALIFQRYNDVVLTVKDKGYVELLDQLEELSKDEECCPFCGKDLSIFLRFARSNSSYKEERVGNGECPNCHNKLGYDDFGTFIERELKSEN